MEDVEERSIRVLCRKLVLHRTGQPLQWLIGSPFFSPSVIVSTIRCIHCLSPPESLSIDYQKESEDLRTLLPKGFGIIGALIVGSSSSVEQDAGKAIDAARRLKKLLSRGEKLVNQSILGAVSGSDSTNAQFFVSRSENSSLDSVSTVVYEDHPDKYIWERGCLLKCELPMKLPFYFPVKDNSGMEKRFSHVIEVAAEKLRDPQVVFIVESLGKGSEDGPQPVVLRSSQLDFHADLLKFKVLHERDDSIAQSLSCADFCLKNKSGLTTYSAENADIIQVSLLLNSSKKDSKSTTPVAEYLPAMEEAELLVVDFRLEVLCYAARDLPLSYAISNLIIPGLVDQLDLMKNTFLPNLLTQHPRLRPYHFCPPGFLNPITIIYELSYGETEMKQVEGRKSLHLRLGLPFDRPLLRIANALDFSPVKHSAIRKGLTFLKDVHIGIPSSGVSGGSMSLVQGSYEYYHYFQDGYNDSGWGCAYRSLQTIFSWFRLQHYTSIEVPSHREIQEALVEIGDKDPSFIGSREWIGAIELSFVLDKLLGVSCKILNVRSGAEIPEKCRELASHFENQGTPIMIGGSVLAYTLLGVDYNEASGDCAFLILDPHYTGSDELKKIWNGGWCGWKKAVDSKGKNFFVQDRFYNFLLPQRPNMV